MNHFTLIAVLISFLSQQAAFAWEEDHHSPDVQHENILVERFAYLADAISPDEQHQALSSTGNQASTKHLDDSDRDCGHCHHCHHVSSFTLLMAFPLHLSVPPEQHIISFSHPLITSFNDVILRPPIQSVIS